MLTSICPILPSRSFEKTIEFYEPLGFKKMAVFEAEGYLILQREKVELHFFRHLEHIKEQSDHGAFVRVDNAKVLSDQYATLNLASEGIPRVTRAEHKPWGICEFAVVDVDGNLLRIGHIN